MPQGKSARQRITIKDHGPDPVDVAVGHQLRIRRSLLGLSQGALAEALGLSFQQVQKYEKGANRITCGRLWQLAGFLDVPVSYFFLGATDTPQTRRTLQEIERADDPILSRETLELARAFVAIRDPVVRENLRMLIVSAASEGPADPEPDQQ